MKRLIIVGASGLIGGHLHELARQEGVPVIGTCCHRPRPGLLYFDMLRTGLDRLVDDLCGDDVVCLLAAYSNPSWIFDNIDTASRLNLDASKALIDTASDRGARVVFMSSVEVFDGIAGNYGEEAVPAPLNAYGRMKFELERYLMARSPSSCIVRTGWNVGMATDHRCVVALTYETLLRPGAKMARDNVFSLTDVRETAIGLLRICREMVMPVCHLAASPPVCRLELAAMIKKQSRFGEEMDYREVSFDDIPYSEPRGKRNQLDCGRTVARYGLTFTSPAEVVQGKIELLDQSGLADRIRKGLCS